MLFKRRTRIHFFSLIITVIILLLSCKEELQTNSQHFDPVEAMYANNIHDLLFDDDWKFHKGRVEGAEDPSFDDSTWRTLDLPHDWSIEDLNLKSDEYNDIEPKPAGPFSPDSPGDISTGYVLGLSLIHI